MENVLDEYKTDDKDKPDLRNLNHNLEYIDVTRNAATTKVLLYRNKELLTIDYISEKLSRNQLIIILIILFKLIN